MSFYDMADLPVTSLMAPGNRFVLPWWTVLRWPEKTIRMQRRKELSSSWQPTVLRSTLVEKLIQQFECGIGQFALLNPAEEVLDMLTTQYRVTLPDLMAMYPRIAYCPVVRLAELSMLLEPVHLNVNMETREAETGRWADKLPVPLEASGVFHVLDAFFAYLVAKGIPSVTTVGKRTVVKFQHVCPNEEQKRIIQMAVDFGVDRIYSVSTSVERL